ncbi:nuclear pore complex protein Nup214-like [Cimex lectularius]|uniref:Nucleoporin Nup159/Nup146 N-terminal domain-containing protein n=1 Tax=Cimex lectularius TaxID=79782 RepID=A0A8I6RCG7_CIMLE|nr:nuclear pore complex protein Nup214-like [Cimex lectularius]
MENPPSHINALEEFKFKLLCQLQIFPNGSGPNCKTPLRLVATSNKYGLVFIGDNQGFQCIHTNSVILYFKNEFACKRGKIATYPRRHVPLESIPSHLDVNSDGEFLAVVTTHQDCPFLYVYSTQSFGSDVIEKKFQVTLSSTQGVKVLDIQWNPGVANMIGIVTSDGAAMVCEFTANGPTINSIPANSQSMCLCWSPKGKRIVIGSKGGSIMQYMPDMKVVKAIPTPSLPMKSIDVISIRWLSNTQYIVVYKDNKDQSGNTAVIVINVQQNQQPHFINYEDLCCGTLTERPEHYFIHIPPWSVIVLGCGNALETAVLKQSGDSWAQWIIDDGNRAELPLTEDHSDVYNVGMAFDFSSQFPVPIGENQTIDPVPLLLMLSHAGVLCLFHCINSVRDAPKLCSEKEYLSLHNFVNKAPETSQRTDAQPAGTNTGTTADLGYVEMPTLFNTGATRLPTGQATGNFQMSQPPVGQTSMAFQFPQSPMEQSSFGFQSTSQSQPVQLKIPQPTTSVPKSTSLQFQGSLGGFQQVPQKTDQIQKPNLFNQAQNTATGTSVAAPVATSPMVPIFGLNTSKNSNKALDTNNSYGFFGQQPVTTVATTKSMPSSAPTPTQPENNTEASVSKPAQAMPQKTEDPVESKKASAEALEKEKREKEKAIVDSLIKESKSVENEFNDFKKKIAKFDLTPGDESVLISIPNKVADLELFEKDLSETTSTQSSEVNVLRCSLVEIYGWVENIKAKDRQVKSQRYLDCLESQALDPIVKRHLRSIEQQMHFFESQVKQVTASLDSLWSNYKSKNKNTIDVPNLESIYEAIVNQTYILAVQKNIVSELQNKIKQVLRNKTIVPQVIEYSSPSYNSKTGGSDLDILADKLLHTKINNKSPSKSFKETSYRYIVLANAKKHLSSSKENILIQWHKSHKVISTKAAKPYSFSDEDEELYKSPLSPVSIVEKVTTPTKEESPAVQEPVQQKPITSKSPFTLSGKTSSAPSSNLSSLQFAYSTVTKAPSVPVVKESTKSTAISTAAISTAFPTSTFTVSEMGKNSFGTDVQITKAPPKTSASPVSNVIMYEEVSNTTPVKPTKTVSLSQFTNSTIFGGSQDVSSSLTSSWLSASGSAFKLPTSSTATTTTSATSQPTSQPFAQFALTNTQVSLGAPAKTESSTNIKTSVAAATTSTSLATPTTRVENTSVVNPSTEASSIFGSNSSFSLLSLGGSAFSFPSLSSTPSTTSTKLTTAAETTVNSKSTNVAPTAKPAASDVSFDQSKFSPISFSETSVSTAPTSVSLMPSLITTETQVVSFTTTPQEQSKVTSTSSVMTTGTTSTTNISTTKSIFPILSTAATTSTTTAPSLFGSTSFSSPSFFSNSSTANVFGGSSIFGTSASSLPTATTVSTVSTASSLFGGTTSSITFGSPVTTTSSTTTSVSQQSVFNMSSPSSQPSIFGGTPATTSASVFGSSNMTTPVFGSPATTSTSIFGSPISTPLFGTPSTTTTSSIQPIFGGTPSTTSSLFGSPVTAVTTSTTLFGSPATAVTTSTSLFGSPATAVTTSTSLFGSPATTVTTSTSLFGSPATAVTTSASVFGAAQALGSTSFFSTPSTIGNAFMNQPQSPQPFGGAQPQTTSSFNTPFFQKSTPTTNVFGAPAFGQNAAITASSMFTGTSTFKQTSENIFGNATTPNKFATNSGSIFGGSSFSSPTQQPTFSSGQTGGLFGSSNAFSNVGQPNVSQSGFGSQPTFGSSGTSIFGGQTTFGTAPTFGSSATFGSPKKVFGDAAPKSTFGSPTQQSSTFENLAGQNTLTFGNLAQNQGGFNSTFGNASPTQQPAFPATTFGGSSFSNWR